jgi:hypothetical protein
MPTKSEELLKDILLAINDLKNGDFKEIIFKGFYNTHEHQIAIYKELVTVREEASKLASLKQEIGDISALKEEICNLKTELQNLKSSIELCTQPLNGLKSSIDGLNTDLCKSFNSEEDEEEMIKRQATQAKTAMNSSWKRALNQRKQLRYQHLRNENIVFIYSEWISSESYMPSKFKPRTIPSESETEREIRMKLAKQKMTSEVELCQVRAQKNLQKLEEVDSAIIAEITEKYDGALAERLKELYRQECESSDSKALADGLKHKSWLQDLPSSEQAKEDDRNTSNGDESESEETEFRTVTYKRKPTKTSSQNQAQRSPSISIQVQRHRNSSLHKDSHQHRKPSRKDSTTEPSNPPEQARSKPYQPRRGNNMQLQRNVNTAGHFLGRGQRLRGKQD